MKPYLSWVLALSLLGSGCSRAGAATPEEFQGLIEFEESVLSFQSGGKLKRIAVQRGQVVERGSLLAELDDDVERPVREQRLAELAGAKANVALVREGPRVQDLRSIEGELDSARAEEALASSQLERSKQLLASSSIAAAALEESEARQRAAVGRRVMIEERAASLRTGARRGEIGVAQATLEATSAALATIDAKLATFALRAPVSGLVVDVDARVGETVPAAAPVLILADVERPRVDVFVSQARVGALKLGQPVRLRVDGVAKTYPGRIEDIGRRLEFTPRFLFSERERPNLVVRVRVRVENADGYLHAGVPAFVTFN
ncbi:MAG TPA: HlyD family efflux transporter periplasmic adaptor subunit [Polyangiaceae bacterium]|nr:HlyD family efflux transporter periplasmic adaptor subunit [Polyangiaceae bacterium]